MPTVGDTYLLAYGLARPFKNAADKLERTKGTGIRPDLSGDLSVGIGNVVLLGIPGPKAVSVETNLAEDVSVAFYNVASPKTQAAMSAPNLPVTFSAVTRGETTIINVNNPKVYAEFLELTENGTLQLGPGQIVGSPPIPSGLVPHPEWASKFLHAEFQGELELNRVFDLTGPGRAWSFPNPVVISAFLHCEPQGLSTVIQSHETWLHIRFQ